MAIINEDGHYIGPLGNVRFYILNGKNVVATKGGPSANDIKKKASYAYTRAHNSEFGIVSKVASSIYSSHQATRPFRYPYAYQELKKYLFKMLSFDVVHPHGERSLLFSKADQHFRYMQITPKNYAEMVRIRIEVSQLKAEEITLNIQPTAINSYITFSAKYDQMVLDIYLQGVKDVVYQESLKKYNFHPYQSVLPLVPSGSFEFYKHLNPEEIVCTCKVSPDYHYMVFAVATFRAKSKPNLLPIHTAACIHVVPSLDA
ncbi:MAG: hypothetical protein U0T36_12350 [Saprospiraceae bacterium]